MYINMELKNYPQTWKRIKSWHWSERLYNYNNFFNPNICHVCKKVYKDTALIPCNQCHMIFYCSTYHKDKHFEQHYDFCKILTNYFRRVVDEQRNTQLTIIEWFKRRKRILHEIETDFGNLLMYEKQMILDAKSCVYCHRQSNLQPCEKCYNVNFCNEHNNEPLRNHPFCHFYTLSFNLSLLNLNYSNFSKYFNILIKKNKSFHDMFSYITKYFSYHRKLRYFNTNSILHSDYISDPLTVYDAMQKATLLDIINTEKCVIHIILATPLEKKHIPAWEILLHLLDKIKKLTIVLIGIELQENYQNDCKLCFKCRQIDKSLKYQCYAMNYTKSNISKYSLSKPNVIIAFQVYFDSYVELWKDNLNHPKSLYLFTAGSSEIATENIIQPIRLLPTAIQLVDSRSSNFQSLLPYKLFHKNYFGYRNAYTTIFENIDLEEPAPYKYPIETIYLERVRESRRELK